MNKTHEELCEEVQQLRQGIRQLAANLRNGEWADLLTADQDLGDLEDAVRSLVETRADRDDLAATLDEASALRRYANRLHPDHCCRQYLLEEADHVERQTRGWSSEEGAGSAMDNRMLPPLRTPPPPGGELSELAQVEARIVQAIEKVLGITADELEPPILKDHGDVEHARQMDRWMLEEKYALARMAARLATFHLKRAQAAEPDVIRENLRTRVAVLEEELEHTRGQRDDAIHRAQVSEGERDAQAARVERFIEIRDEFMSGKTRSYEACSAFLEAARDASTASLVRRDADLLQRWASELDRRSEHERERNAAAASGMGAAAILLRHEADRLHRQAEGGAA